MASSHLSNNKANRGKSGCLKTENKLNVRERVIRDLFTYKPNVYQLQIAPDLPLMENKLPTAAAVPLPLLLVEHSAWRFGHNPYHVT